MAKRYTPSPLWQKPPPDLTERLRGTLGKIRPPQNGAVVFFRADDIGLPGKRYGRMLDSFRTAGVPLALAVVPAWLPLRTDAFLSQTGGDELWCLHMHGLRHRNHEPSGKKQEFGPARPVLRIRGDLQQGMDLLDARLGSRFFPAFTPPWNRCSGEALDSLVELGFLAVSRSRGATPKAPERLPDLFVNVDLHTRREPDPDASLDALLHELRVALERGWCGVMLHHQRSNKAADAFLDLLLNILAATPDIRFSSFSSLLSAPVRLAAPAEGDIAIPWVRM